MAKGQSGRIVIEIDPEMKAQLYDALKKDGKTLKEWFLAQAESYLFDNIQLGLRFDQEAANQK
jgi:hypothetical protein